MTWIAGNGGDDSPWHLARREERRGAVTGRLMAVYQVASCSGRQLGGPWGQSTAAELPEGARVCKRCAALAKVAP